jgi:hypothetical protein
MKIAICRLDDCSVTVRNGLGRRMGNGAVVDLDDVIGTHCSGAPLTLADALGDLVTHFEVVAPVLPSPVLDVDDDGGSEG